MACQKQLRTQRRSNNPVNRTVEGNKGAHRRDVRERRPVACTGQQSTQRTSRLPRSAPSGAAAAPPHASTCSSEKVRPGPGAAGRLGSGGGRSGSGGGRSGSARAAGWGSARPAFPSLSSGCVEQGARAGVRQSTKPGEISPGREVRSTHRQLRAALRHCRRHRRRPCGKRRRAATPSARSARPSLQLRSLQRFIIRIRAARRRGGGEDLRRCAFRRGG